MSQTVLLKSRNTPCGAPGDFHWNTPDDVVEVPAELAIELLRIGHAGFYEVIPSEATAVAAEPVVHDHNEGYHTYENEGLGPKVDITKAAELEKDPGALQRAPASSTPEGRPKLQESIDVAAPPIAKKAQARKAAARKKA